MMDKFDLRSVMLFYTFYFLQLKKFTYFLCFMYIGTIFQEDLYFLFPLITFVTIFLFSFSSHNCLGVISIYSKYLHSIFYQLNTVNVCSLFNCHSSPGHPLVGYRSSLIVSSIRAHGKNIP